MSIWRRWFTRPTAAVARGGRVERERAVQQAREAERGPEADETKTFTTRLYAAGAHSRHGNDLDAGGFALFDAVGGVQGERERDCLDKAQAHKKNCPGPHGWGTGNMADAER